MLEIKFSTVCDVLNLRRCDGGGSETYMSLATRIQQLSEIQMHELCKDDLIKLMEGIGPRPSASLRKAQLVQKLLEAQEKIQNGELEIPEPPQLSEEQLQESKTKRIPHSLRLAAIQSWVMKPLVATSGMKEGSINEAEVLNALPTFFKERNSTYAWRINGIGNSGEGLYSRQQGMKIPIQFLRTVGLVCSARNEMLGDSPDGICALTDECGTQYVLRLKLRQ